MARFIMRKTRKNYCRTDVSRLKKYVCVLINHISILNICLEMTLILIIMFRLLYKYQLIELSMAVHSKRWLTPRWPNRCEGTDCVIIPIIGRESADTSVSQSCHRHHGVSCGLGNKRELRQTVRRNLTRAFRWRHTQT